MKHWMGQCLPGRNNESLQLLKYRSSYCFSDVVLVLGVRGGFVVAAVIFVCFFTLTIYH